MKFYEYIDLMDSLETLFETGYTNNDIKACKTIEEFYKELERFLDNIGVENENKI